MCVCDLFKCARVSLHIGGYACVYCLTLFQASVCVSFPLTEGEVESACLGSESQKERHTYTYTHTQHQGGGVGGCGESVQRLLSRGWCDTEASQAQTRPKRFSLPSSCLPQLNLAVGTGKVITSLHRAM